MGMEETRTSTSGTMTCDEYRKRAISWVPEIADVKSNDFSVYDYWNRGSPVDWCTHCFMESKAYRKVLWVKRKNNHGRAKT